jgi:hypothetical protein
LQLNFEPLCEPAFTNEPGAVALGIYGHTQRKSSPVGGILLASPHSISSGALVQSDSPLDGLQAEYISTQLVAPIAG